MLREAASADRWVSGAWRRWPALARSAGNWRPRCDRAHRPAVTASAVLAWWTVATCSAGAGCAWPGRLGRARRTRGVRRPTGPSPWRI